jgi:dTDP-4-dehydrorhamnose 3,5-epimerase
MADVGNRFQLDRLPLDGLLLITRNPAADERGFLARVYDRSEFSAHGIDRPVAQINHSLTSRAGVVRGMHWQYPPYAEVKLVSCLRGEVFDVAVDLRRGSPTFLRWHGEVLSATNHRSLFIPEGFAHGFQALGDDCELLYLHSAPYVPAAEGRINPLDPRLAIAWPLPIGGTSLQDAERIPLPDDFPGATL